jgi:hypothetical protein
MPDLIYVILILGFLSACLRLGKFLEEVLK